jgi:hypothetical protein
MNDWFSFFMKNEVTLHLGGKVKLYKQREK